MQIEPSIAAARRAVLSAKAAGKRVGFVPTMGALHAGHESLIKAAAAECGFVAVSIFVNPTQFGPKEDLSKYPRTFEADAEMCRRNNVDLIFAPTAQEMYPALPGSAAGSSPTWVNVERISDPLCGAFRPGHFRGVATVVAKLFNIVPADVAYFGQKDAQQCVVIRRMVADLNFPVEIKVMPTVREPDGLAMSSRNKYLGPEDRRNALCLWRALTRAREMADAGERRADVVLAEMKRIVQGTPGTKIDYISAVDPEMLEPAATLGRRTLFALAVRVGPARLIDNIILELPG
jgi:pantoate--beta-alanine ligase